MSQIFLFSWWMGSIAPQESTHSFCLFLLPAALLGALSQPLTIVLWWRLHSSSSRSGMSSSAWAGLRKNVFFKRGEVELVSDANQTGREGGKLVHKSILRQWKVSPTDSLSDWGHLPAIQWSCLWNTEQIGPGTLEVVTDTKSFIRLSDKASVLGGPLTRAMFFVSLDSYLPQIELFQIGLRNDSVLLNLISPI